MQHQAGQPATLGFPRPSAKTGLQGRRRPCLQTHSVVARLGGKACLHTAVANLIGAHDVFSAFTHEEAASCLADGDPHIFLGMVDL